MGAFKAWVRAGRSGYLYDFEVYEGAPATASTVMHGQSSDVVIRLSSSLESNRGYRIAADNFFTSEVVLRELRQRGTNFVRAIHCNRQRRCPLEKAEALKKEVRDSFDMCVRKDEMLAVRRLGCRYVTLLSSYIAAEAVQR